VATLWTIGHSTRSFEELVGVLKSYGVETVVDIRTIPRSRRNPQFNRDELQARLPAEGLEYIYAKDLGGLRKPLKESPNDAWHNDSFRGFADYMQTDKFQAALNWLIEQADKKRTAIMCAEMVPWRCHRSLIADALLVRGFDVVEIFDEEKSRPHELTSFAAVNDGKVTYPASNLGLSDSV
jgi:uncharacterized protein (DUF488 family)